MQLFWAGVLSGLIILSTSVTHAQADSSPAYNVYGIPTNVVREIKAPTQVSANKAPQIACEDSNLLASVKAQIAKAEKSTPDENILDKRHRILARQNLQKFNSVLTTDYTPQDNYTVANRLISLKINKNLKDEDIKLCVAENPVLARRIYLIIYQENDATKVEIVNYRADKRETDLFFFYQE